jgi:putative addiction module CopG family antidote
MNVVLKSKAKKFITQQVKTGRFKSAGDVLDEALSRMMDDRVMTLDQRTLAAIDRSEDQIDRGDYQDWKAVSSKLRTKYLRK